MAMVKIYTTPPCVFCKMSKDFFEKNSIQYQEFNVAQDVQAREEMIRKSGQFGVPVIEINGNLIIGFDRARLAELLGLK